jgi:hypothetical protein
MRWVMSSSAASVASRAMLSSSSLSFSSALLMMGASSARSGLESTWRQHQAQAHGVCLQAGAWPAAVAQGSMLSPQTHNTDVQGLQGYHAQLMLPYDSVISPP